MKKLSKYHYWDAYQNFRARCLALGYEGNTRQQIMQDKQIFEQFMKENIKDEVGKFISRKKK